MVQSEKGLFGKYDTDLAYLYQDLAQLLKLNF